MCFVTLVHLLFYVCLGCVHTHLYTSVYVYRVLHVCREYMYMCMHERVCGRVCSYESICVFVRLYVYMCICAFVYICVYMSLYVCICTRVYV